MKNLAALIELIYTIVCQYENDKLILSGYQLKSTILHSNQPKRSDNPTLQNMSKWHPMHAQRSLDQNCFKVLLECEFTYEYAMYSKTWVQLRLRMYTIRYIRAYISNIENGEAKSAGLKTRPLVC